MVPSERTARVVVASSRTEAPSVSDEEVREPEPVSPRHDLTEVAFYPSGILRSRKPEEARESAKVRIDRDAGDDAVGVAEDDIRRLAPDAGNTEHLRHGSGYLASELALHDTGGGENIPRLTAIETRRKNCPLEGAWIGGDIVVERRVPSEERGCHLIHSPVGTLRRELHGDEELPGRPVGKLTARIGKETREGDDDPPRASARGGTIYRNSISSCHLIFLVLTSFGIP